jgi:hypothetical protein
MDRIYGRHGKEKKDKHSYGQKASRIDSTWKTPVQGRSQF